MSHVSPDGQVERLLSISREITDLKQMQSALIQAEKLAATGRLAATIAHELNNPLDAVTNLIYLAKTSGDASDEAHEYLELADQELARVSHIAQQTLEFYRNQMDPVRVHVSKAIASVLGIYERRLQYKGLRIQRRIDEGLEICTREGELKQILSNLISNAIAASHYGGTIWLRARPCNGGKGAGMQGVRITLADDGTGMSPDVQEKIFTPFFTTKADVGTGIGLWITRSLLEKQGGAIHFRSWQHSKTGTVMSFFVPTAPSYL